MGSLLEMGRGKREGSRVGGRLGGEENGVMLGERVRESELRGERLDGGGKGKTYLRCKKVDCVYGMELEFLD